MSAKESVVVAVPNASSARRLGVFFKGLGIVQIDIPAGLRRGDEFCVEVAAGARFFGANSGCAHVDCPDNMKAGDVFHHRIPSGKLVTVSIPPGHAEYGYTHGLLVPNVLINERMIVQAELAPKPALLPAPLPPPAARTAKGQFPEYRYEHFERLDTDRGGGRENTGDEVLDYQARMLQRYGGDHPSNNNVDDDELACVLQESRMLAEQHQRHRQMNRFALQERRDFLDSLPDDIRQQVLAQETLQERAFN
ncbi:hypothetical protein BASA81_001478 [Batrachochytrium salamandrivorans]|nr:hypothetical protein BASA81_001478 [Batrachochytrium salamandrivorans]